MFIYSMETNTVDSVFFPVVPDSFMSRGSSDRPKRHTTVIEGWREETDTPLVAPRDPWSF